MELFSCQILWILSILDFNSLSGGELPNTFSCCGQALQTTDHLGGLLGPLSTGGGLFPPLWVNSWGHPPLWAGSWGPWSLSSSLWAFQFHTVCQVLLCFPSCLLRFSRGSSICRCCAHIFFKSFWNFLADIWVLVFQSNQVSVTFLSIQFAQYHSPKLLFSSMCFFVCVLPGTSCGCVSFCVLYSGPPASVSALRPVPCCFGGRNFVVYSEVRQHDLLSFVL